MSNHMPKTREDLKKELVRLKKDNLKKSDGIPIISISQVKKTAQTFNLSPKEVEIAALEERIIPTRYRRNFNTVSFAEQITFLKSKVTVAGCGGLGGNIIELLARLGIGSIIAIDGDVFQESNLNRQALCNEDSFGTGKAVTAISRIKHINSSIDAHSYSQFFDIHNLATFIGDTDVVIDALDNIPSRFLLEKVCKELKIPLIHGAINGLQGQASTIFPEDKGLVAIYGPEDKYHKQFTDNQVSVLSVTPAMIASIQVAEVLKVLLKRGKPLQNKLLLINLEENDFNIVDIL
ncbi:MAG TPA: ThiF family adenylyltransferase [Atribacterota bacterium]|nr:ThiF family adenylyltransferase [Atribacterota bacterium]